MNVYLEFQNFFVYTSAPPNSKFWLRHCLNGNTNGGQKDWRKNILGVKKVDRFESYLKLPTLVGCSKYQTSSYFKDNVWKKLQGWKGKILSRVGKEVLIKAVAQLIPTYTMEILWSCVMNSMLCMQDSGGVRLVMRGRFIGRSETCCRDSASSIIEADDAVA